MTTNTHRVALAAALATLLLAPPVFAGSKITPNRGTRFWNFPDTVTADSGAGRENVTRFSPNGADLGNFVLKLGTRHAPTGFAANSFALRFAHFREFENPVGIFDADSLAVTRSTPDLLFGDSFALPKDRISVIAAFQEGDGGGGGGGGGGPTTPEPGTWFAAALALGVVVYSQRGRLFRLR